MPMAAIAWSSAFGGPRAYHRQAELPKRGLRTCRSGAPDGSDKLAHDDQADDEREEGEAFDQCRGDDHVRADGALGFGLPGDGFDGAAADVTDAASGAGDADARADHDAGGTDADAQV